MIWIKKGYVLLLSLPVLLTACSSKKIRDPFFELLDDSRTGLHFSNTLKATEAFNLFKYMYFYNGAGVAAGDFNNDGHTDLFFASNQGSNRIYLNEGDLHFKDITESSKLPQDNGWSTGVSVVDINNDGFLDIYICKVGNFETLKSRNQLLICEGLNKEGLPVYTDQAADYGLNFSGFSTQSVFFDYDLDGDLDMYLLNHSLHQNTNYNFRSPLLEKTSPVSGDRLFRNEGNNRFSDVTAGAGIHSSVIGYGLGVVVSDINLDGYPDIYVGNDFHENDYLYLNNGDGTFVEKLSSGMMHTSKYTMGVDAADINNDGYPEVVTTDMLAENPYILKRSLGEDEYDIFNLKIGFGYNYQYSRNNLQYNRRNGMFSEVGLYSGIAATDWSWAALLFDFDNDGLKDLFISNGIPKRMNDIDYINYVSSEDMQRIIIGNQMNEANMKLIERFPKIKIPNKFFRNEGALLFADIEDKIENDESSYSNGAVYADFDNDGDLDVVVNNIDAPASLYENRTLNKKSNPDTNAAFAIKLNGPKANRNAIGARLFIFANGSIRSYEKNPVKGFMSSMETPLHVGRGGTVIDSMFIVWPDNTYEKIDPPSGKNTLTLSYKNGLPRFPYEYITSGNQGLSMPAADITSEVHLDYLHTENPFVEFDRESLIPHMLSTEGPALSVADINHDGLEDIYIGASKTFKPALFTQDASGSFRKLNIPALDIDSTYEDVDAAFVDINNDGHIDLLVASGGNEYYGTDKFLLPRAYVNDGKGDFSKSENAFSNVFVNASCILPNDFNGDGFQDLFIGGRSIPWKYGEAPRSWLLMNDGTGKFKDVTATFSPQLSNVGMVTGAVWCDLNNDKVNDLVVCSEWGGIDVFLNSKGVGIRKSLTNKKGWWNFIMPFDADSDGDLDFIAGNLGLNSRLKGSETEPVRLYYEDFDGNGTKEQVVTYYIGERELPFTNKLELEKQMPVLKKKFLLAEDFAKSSLQEIFSPDKIKTADVLTADYFSNAILINNGDGSFDLRPLPWQAQLTSYRDAVVINANNDALPDLLLAGNYYENNIQLGRHDADYGTLLINQGHGNFTYESLKGLAIRGQVRRIKKVTINKNEAYILAMNNDSAKVIQFNRGYNMGR